MRILLKILTIAAIGLALARRPGGSDSDAPGGINPNRTPSPPPPVGGFNSGRLATKASFDKGEAGGSSTPNASHLEPGEGWADTGGSRRPKRGTAEEWEWAEEAYAHWRESDADVDAIAQHLADFPRQDGSIGFTYDEILNAKNNVMRDEHAVDNKYEDGAIDIKQFDADPEIAAAWIRLQQGEGNEYDIMLLEHEIAEYNYWQDHPEATYSEAHDAANEVSNWEDYRTTTPYEPVKYK
jgi:hypothetical protein